MTVLSTTLSHDDVHHAGLQVLHRELGLVGMVRFLQQFGGRTRNRPAERAQPHADSTLEDAIPADWEVRAGQTPAGTPLAKKPRPETVAVDASGDELHAKGLEALRRELGPRAFVLFIRQFVEPSGDYTAERAALVGHLTVDEICDAIEERRRAEGERGS